MEGGRCIKVTTQLLTWGDAQTNCFDLGGDLVSIHSQAEQDLVDSLIAAAGAGSTWIGLEKASGTWGWSDGSTYPCPSPYCSWKKKYPQNKVNRDCGYVKNGQWQNTKCNTDYASVCEKPTHCPSTTTTTTSTTTIITTTTTTTTSSTTA